MDHSDALHISHDQALSDSSPNDNEAMEPEPEPMDDELPSPQHRAQVCVQYVLCDCNLVM